MERKRTDFEGLFKNLKGALRKFNSRPFSNTIHLQNKIKKIETQQLVFEHQKLFDNHADIVSKVDALIAQMEQIEQMQALDTSVSPEDESELINTAKVDLSPEKINSDL